MKHILAAVDGSEAAYRALAHAAELSQKLGAELTILIVRLIVVGRKGVYAATRSDEVESIAEKAKEVALASGVTNAKVMVEKSRDTSFKIVDVAIENDADLIIMGASGKGGFKAFLLGSTSQEVLRKSACPVTIVH
ncbi:MAG: universal stress protein [Pseudomonadota bacterium]